MPAFSQSGRYRAKVAHSFSRSGIVLREPGANQNSSHAPGWRAWHSIRRAKTSGSSFTPMSWRMTRNGQSEMAGEEGASMEVGGKSWEVSHRMGAW